jgi:hypothetical protein
MDGSEAHEAAITSAKTAHVPHSIIRQGQELPKMVAQAQRAVQRVTRPMLGGKSFAAAQDTLVGIEILHMSKKRPLVGEEGEEGLAPAEPFSARAASSLHRYGQLPLHEILNKMCDITVFCPTP